MSNKQISASLLIIDGVPVKHFINDENNNKTNALLQYLLDINGGKIMLKNDYYGKCEIATVADCWDWGSYHGGVFSFIDDVYDVSGKCFNPIVLSSQWYPYNYPEYKNAINKYCDENSLTRPDDMWND